MRPMRRPGLPPPLLYMRVVYILVRAPRLSRQDGWRGEENLLLATRLKRTGSPSMVYRVVQQRSSSEHSCLSQRMAHGWMSRASRMSSPAGVSGIGKVIVRDSSRFDG